MVSKCMFVAMLPFIFVLHFSYREKALQDAAAVSKHVERLLQSVGKVCYVVVLIE